MELWIFVGILQLALVTEGVIKFYKSRLVDNPALR
jgi:hypothetical protein